MRQVKILRYALCVIQMTATLPLFAQAIKNEFEARTAAARYLALMDRVGDVGNATCELLQSEHDAWPGRWTVSIRGDFSLVIIATTGQLDAYSDTKADILRHDRKLGNYERAIKSEEQAWQIAEQFLDVMGVGDMGLVRVEFSGTADMPGADSDRNNRADMYTCRFGTLAKGYEQYGYVNDASVRMDVVTGVVLSARASMTVRFVPPESTISKDAAVARLKVLFAAERAATFLKAKSLHIEEHMPTWYDWPGDAEIRSKMSLKIWNGGGAILTSNYGEQLAYAAKSRLCWATFLPHGEFYIDAENGEPVMFGIYSSIPDGTTKTNGEQSIAGQPERQPGTRTSPTRTSAKPPQSSASSDSTTLIWIALGSVAAVGAGLLAWKSLLHRT